MGVLVRMRSVTWQEVFDYWRESEADAGWDTVWKERGFESWDQWRETYADELGLAQATWEEFEVSRDPREFAAGLWAGGFNGWADFWPEGTQCARMSQIADHPNVPHNDKIKKILEDFPKKTTIMLLSYATEYTVFEGMHRCATLALMKKWGQPVDTQLRAFVASLPVKRSGLFGSAKRLGFMRSKMGPLYGG